MLFPMVPQLMSSIYVEYYIVVFEVLDKLVNPSLGNSYEFWHFAAARTLQP